MIQKMGTLNSETEMIETSQMEIFRIKSISTMKNPLTGSTAALRWQKKQ